MSLDPSARDNVHGMLIEDYVPDYIETKWTIDATDIDMNLNLHPITKDIVTKRNEQAIKQNIVNLVLLNYFDKPFRPHIGGDIYRMLFENFGEDAYIDVAKSNIKKLIIDYEPRVKTLAVNVEAIPDENKVKITIYFKIIATLIEDYVDFTMTIAR